MSETISMLALKKANACESDINIIKNKVIPNMITSVNEIVNNVQNDINQFKLDLVNYDELIDVLVTLAGTEKITEVLKVKRLERAQARATLEQEQVTVALAEGKLKSEETVTEGTLLVLKEHNSAGEPLESSRVQYETKVLKPEFRDQFMGKPVGTRVTSPNGNIFEVMEIYTFVPQASAAGATPEVA